MLSSEIILLVAIALCFYMAWGIGANDVANAMGTSVGSGALTLRQAVIIAAIMELAGAVLVGSHVTDTVRKGIFDPSGLPPRLLVSGFLGALLAAAVWLQVATHFGWPVSTTHSIVGAVVGVGVAMGGVSIIDWPRVGTIVLSWVTSPVCGGIIAYLIYQLIQKQILFSKAPVRAACRWTPFLVFYVGFVLTLVTLFKGLNNLNLDLGLPRSILLALGGGAVCYGCAVLALRGIGNLRESGAEGESGATDGVRRGSDATEVGADEPGAEGFQEKATVEFRQVESIFGKLLIISACFLAFAHGANDVANAIGPLAAVVDIVNTGTVAMRAAVPLWILLLGGVGIVVGLSTWGYKVIETIGRKITELTPSRGFAANVGAATTIVLASRLGFPISTTHTLVGAVLGVGLARGSGHLNFRVLREILISWLITIPAGAALAIVFYHIFRALLV